MQGQRELETARLALKKTDPFLGILLDGCLEPAANEATTIVQPTAVKVHIDPSLPAEQLQIALKHEALHVALRHHQLGGRRVREAADLAIEGLTSGSELSTAPQNLCAEAYLRRFLMEGDEPVCPPVPSQAADTRLTAAANECRQLLQDWKHIAGRLLDTQVLFCVSFPTFVRIDLDSAVEELLGLREELQAATFRNVDLWNNLQDVQRAKRFLQQTPGRLWRLILLCFRFNSFGDNRQEDSLYGIG